MIGLGAVLPGSTGCCGSVRGIAVPAGKEALSLRRAVVYISGCPGGVSAVPGPASS